MTGETEVLIESVRSPSIRTEYGDLADLAASLDTDGQRHPITLWSDGTLISGGRRLRAQMRRMASTIPAVFVDTIEDAAKRLMADNADDHLAKPMSWSEVCRLWELLTRLDEPAAARRAVAARKRGVELRRQTLAGTRPPSRSPARVGEDYLLGVISEPFGVSEATAARVRLLYRMAHDSHVQPEHQALAVQTLADLESGAISIWRGYERIMKAVKAPAADSPAVPKQSAPAARQRASWDRALPQLEGLIAGLVELGPPNPDLSWEQVGPVHARLSKARRDLEKIIKTMRENTQP